MKKWLIVYSSSTGNTKVIAEAIKEALPVDTDIFNVREVPEDLSAYEVIAVGYWLSRGGPDKLMQDFLPHIKEKAVVLFETHGTMPGSEHAITAFARAACLLGGDCTILGTFGCQGRINPMLLEKRRQGQENDPHANTKENAERWAMAATHPDRADLDAAMDFARLMQRKIVMLESFAKRQIEKA